MINTTNTSTDDSIERNNYKQIIHKCSLKEIRIAKGLTQSDVAREIGKSSEFINMIEHGRHFPILETRIKIAKALDVDSTSIWIPIDVKLITADQYQQEQSCCEADDQSKDGDKNGSG